LEELLTGDIYDEDDYDNLALDVRKEFMKMRKTAMFSAIHPQPSGLTIEDTFHTQQTSPNLKRLLSG